MSNPRDTSTTTSAQTIDPSTTTDQVVQPIEQPLADGFTGASIGDDTVNNPVIINR